ncbi:MAG: hypothetical protein ACLQUW_12415 [Desulfobaccales bacterium]
MRVKNFINNIFGKKITDVETFANGLFLDFYNKDIFRKMYQLFDGFIRELYGKDIPDDSFNQIYNEWIYLRLALGYNLTIIEYNAHPNINKIEQALRNRVSSILLFLVGEKYINFCDKLFQKRALEYRICLEDKNDSIKSVATLFKFIIETRIRENINISEDMISLSIAQKWSLPSAYHSAQYYFLIGPLITSHQKIIKKWSIAKIKNATSLESGGKEK